MTKIVKYMSPTGSESMDDRATVDARCCLADGERNGCTNIVLIARHVENNLMGNKGGCKVGGGGKGHCTTKKKGSLGMTLDAKDGEQNWAQTLLRAWDILQDSMMYQKQSHEQLGGGR